MSSIQIENVPPDLHSRLRERARREGLSLSEYALEALKRHLELPPTREWLERIWSDDAVGGVTSEEITSLIREGRAERDGQIIAAIAAGD